MKKEILKKFVGRSKYCLEIFNNTWEKLARSSLLRSLSKRMKINRNGGDLLTASECWEFFLVFKGRSNHSPSPEEVCGGWLRLWNPQLLLHSARFTNPKIEYSGAKMYYNTLFSSENLMPPIKINPAKRRTFGTVLLSRKWREHASNTDIKKEKKKRKWGLFQTSCYCCAKLARL